MHRVDGGVPGAGRRRARSAIVALDGARPAAEIAEEIREHVRALL